MRAFVLLLLAPAFVPTDNLCPWMNAATAGGVLGGPVTMTVEGGTCTFARPASELKIEVAVMADTKKEFGAYLARCVGRGIPIAAIGNEAVACPGEATGSVVEQAIGRVRNQAFVIRLAARDRGFPREILREKARKVAEQVAGILF